MIGIFDKASALIDKLVETGVRRAARRTDRRSFLARAGTLLVGGAILPLLPYDRSGGYAFAAEPAGDESLDCDYWRYCALDGPLCETCGGTLTACPPGTEASSVSWVGTCRNPKNGKDYLISYSDCCGKTPCMQGKMCNSNEGERPPYRLGLNNDNNWCMANQMVPHCTVSYIVGVAE